jgi:thiosulfate/3-mercaptopyruvate sulfurtransferase
MGSTDVRTPIADTSRLAARLQDSKVRVLDCTVVMLPTPDGGYTFRPGREEYDAGHIPGAVFVDVLGELSDKRSPLPMMMPPVEEFAETMAHYGVGEGTQVVLYDRGNHAWAARVWWMLRVAGFDDAAVLNGGFQKWVAEKRPVSTEPVSYPRGTFKPRPRPELMATREQVLKSIGNREVSLINALSPEEFRGEKLRFPRAGRIQGSVNVYCQSLIDPGTQAFLPEAELRKKFEASGALGARQAITYCGAGIAASADALALTLLGMENVAVYDGSMAEWTADPSLPMETG